MLDRVAPSGFQRKSDWKLRRALERFPNTPVIESFKKLPSHLKSRSRWWKQFDRKVLPHQVPKAIVAWTFDSHDVCGTLEPGADEIVWTFQPRVVTIPVKVYSADQTHLVKKHARTKALEAYWDYFCQQSHPKFKVAYRADGEARTWQGKITEDEAKNHILGVREFAVRSGKVTHHIGIDPDLHKTDDPIVFRRQFEVLLDRFWGQDTWHLQVRRELVTGAHLLRVFESPVDAAKVVAELRGILHQLDKEHPQLAADAKAAKMRPFSKMEIIPTESNALRLPLAPGRVMLLDQPLETTTYRGKIEPDMVGYIKWVEDALAGNAAHMSKADVLQYVMSRLPSIREGEGSSTPIIVPPQKTSETSPSTDEATTAVVDAEAPQTDPEEPKTTKTKMKGRSWELITNAWSGAMESDTLNQWIRQISLYTPFRFSTQAEAVEIIQQFIDELPDHSFSDRLSGGQRSRVTSVIAYDVAKAFSGWGDQPDPEGSAKKLKAAWKRWTATGRDLFDKTTWSQSAVAESFESIELPPDFEWTDEEWLHLKSIAALLKADADQASAAVRHFVRLIRVHPEIPRTWIVKILEQHGIKARSKKLDKPKRLIDELIGLGWIYEAAKHYVGRCRKWGLGTLRTKFSVDKVEGAQEWVLLTDYERLRQLEAEHYDCGCMVACS